MSHVVLPLLVPLKADTGGRRRFISKYAEDAYKVFDQEFVGPLVPHVVGEDEHALEFSAL